MGILIGLVLLKVGIGRFWMNRDIGKMGESTFLNLCNQVDITANASSVDRYGWDYILEFPNNYENSNLPIDMQDMPIECKVQVKATDTNTGKHQIKLSAIHSLVRYKYPAFVCFINYNKGIEPFEIFLLHIDETIIAKVLKSVRKNEIRNKKLNDVKITIHYTEEDKLKSIDGEALKIKLEASILNGMKPYIENKNRLLETVGFSEQSMLMKFTTDSSIINLINNSLGLSEELVSIRNQSLTMSRFDMALPFDSSFNNASDLQMKIQPQKNGEVILFVRKDKFSSSLKYTLDVYLSPFQIKDKPKTVLKNNNLTLIFDFIENKHSLHLSFESSKLYTFSDLYHNLKLCKLMNENQNIYMYLEKNNKFLSEFVLQVDKNIISESMLYSYSLVSRLMEIIKELEVKIDYEISLEEIEGNIMTIEGLHHYLFEDFTKLIATYTEEELINNQSIALNKGGYLVPFPLLFKDELIIVYIIFLTNNELLEEKEFRFIPYKRIIHNVFFIKYNEANEEFYLNLQQKIRKDLFEDDINIVIHDNRYINELKKKDIF